MYDVLKNHLTHGAYTLKDAEERIDYFVASGRITPTQAAELHAVAGDNANGPGGLADEVQALRRELEDIKRLFAGDDAADDEETAS